MIGRREGGGGVTCVYVNVHNHGMHEGGGSHDFTCDTMYIACFYVLKTHRIKSKSSVLLVIVINTTMSISFNYYLFTSGLASANEDMSALVYSWANSEPQLADHIRKMGSCFEANTSALSSLVWDSR